MHRTRHHLLDAGVDVDHVAFGVAVGQAGVRRDPGHRIALVAAPLGHGELDDDEVLVLLDAAGAALVQTISAAT